jgi:hypothetical protein
MDSSFVSLPSSLWALMLCASKIQFILHYSLSRVQAYTYSFGLRLEFGLWDWFESQKLKPFNLKPNYVKWVCLALLGFF